MAELMRVCQLRAGLSRATAVAPLVLGNPKSWLGLSYHKVLEGVARAVQGTDVDALVESMWTAEINSQAQRASAHDLDKRYGPPERWPGYYLARAAVQLRAGELKLRRPSAGTSSAQGAGDLHEEKFVAFNGELVGRPDVVSGDDVIDYKSGAILELDEISQAEVVKAAYVRQLRIYGYLVHARFGRWPKRGVLLPLAGPGVDVPLDAAACEAEAQAAVSLLTEYNSKIAAGATATDLATPSEASCKWCSFKLICPAFWKAVSPAWSGELDGATVEGTLDGNLRDLSGGGLGASINVSASSEPAARAEVAPLSASLHLVGGNAQPVAGERVRVVGLRVRTDGRLIPTIRTTLARVADLPEF